jgi:putative Mn2+ efflux pump MntP
MPGILSSSPVGALAPSIDNLAVGFALGTYHVSVPLATAVIGTVSVVMSLAGLELGARIGMRAGQRSELLGGLILIGVGVAIGAGVIQGLAAASQAAQYQTGGTGDHPGR